MGKSAPSLMRVLRDATKNLTYQSESDYPVEPFVEPAKDEESQSPRDFVAAKAGGAAAVSETDFDNFFAAVAEEQDWQSAEARQSAKRFRSLVETLKANLTDIKVYKVGDVEADVYVVGRTAAGELAGVTTKVVET
jgi:hypothetical protein